MTERSKMLTGCRLVSFTLISLLLKVTAVSGAAYNPYQYDMTIPQFTPDGRLLQVEYASAAADHSTPLVVVRLNDDMTLLVVSKHRNKVQERLILLPESDTVIGISGVFADSLALVQNVQRQSLQNRFSMGRSLTAQQIAKIVGSACQLHTFGYGIRCYGSTLVVCGVEEESMVVFQTDPSGALRDLRQGSRFAVVGGAAHDGGTGPAIQHRLNKKLPSVLRGKGVADAVTEIVKLMLGELLRSGKVKRGDLLFEVAVVSSKHGAYKLTDKQVETIVSKV